MADKVVQEFVLLYKTQGEAVFQKAKREYQALQSKVLDINKNIETQEKSLASAKGAKARQTIEGNINASYAKRSQYLQRMIILEKQLGGVERYNEQQRMLALARQQLALAKGRRMWVNNPDAPPVSGMNLRQLYEREQSRRAAINEYFKLKNMRSRDIIRYSDNAAEVEKERQNIVRRSQWISENTSKMRQNERQMEASRRAHVRLLQSYQKLDPLRQFNRSLEKLNTVFIRVRDAFISFAILRATQLVVGGFFRTIVEANATMEELDARLRVMTGGGGAFERLRQHILDITVTTPFVIKDFVQATVALTAFGLRAEKYLKPLADWASAVGKDIDDVALAFAKVARGSPRTALLLSTRGISKAEFDQEFRRIGDAATALTNILKRKFAGMSETVSRTFKGLLSNVSDMWFQVAMVIGEPIFRELKDDVRELYITLDRWRKTPPTWLIAFGKAVAFLYDNLKQLSVIIAGFVIVKFARALTVSLMALTAWVMKGGRALAYLSKALAVAQSTANLSTKIGRIATLLTPLANIVTTIGFAFSFLIMESDRLNETWVRTRKRAEEVGKSIRETGLGSDQTKNLLEDQVRDLEEYMSTWSEFVRRIGAGWEVLKQFVWTWNVFRTAPEYAAQRNFLEESERKAEEELDIAKNRLEVSKRMNEELHRQLQLMKEMVDVQESAYELAQAAEQGGPQAFSFLKTAQSVLAGLVEQQAKIVEAGTKAASPLSQLGQGPLRKADSVDADVAKSKLDMYSNLSEVLQKAGLGVKAVREELVKMYSTPDYLQRMFGSAESTSTAIEGLIKILGFLFKAEKAVSDHQEKYVQPNLEEITRLRERHAELLAGESKLEAKIAGNKAFAGAIEQMYGPRTWQDEIAYLKAKIAILEDEAQLTENLLDAQRRLYDAINDVSEAEKERAASRTERIYQQTADVEGYRQALLNQIKDLEKRASLALDDRFFNERMAWLEKGNEVLYVKYRTNAEKALKLNTDLLKEIEDVKDKLYELVSEDFGTAMEKALTQLSHTLNSFWDTLATTVLGETQSLLFDLTKMFLDFVGAQEETNTEVEQARRELEALYREREFQNQQLNQIRRRADESNDEYLQRLAELQGLQAKEAMIYEYKTKELELLERINQAEAERNNLLLQRLQQFGTKIFDTFLNQAVGLLTRGIFSSFGSTGPGPGTPYESTPILGRPVSGGVVVQVNGPVYGFDDFERKVDTAVRNVNARRSR